VIRSVHGTPLDIVRVRGLASTSGWEEAKGVNVHSASESVTLVEFPGYAEAKGGGEDCSKCVGKTFVAKGMSMPAGKSAAEVVKEEQLPAASRIIKHSDGIPYCNDHCWLEADEQVERINAA
jgi:hypothetical protein